MKMAGISDHETAISILRISIDHVFDFNVIYSCIHWDDSLSRFHLVRCDRKGIVEVMYHDKTEITSMTSQSLIEEMEAWINKNRLPAGG